MKAEANQMAQEYNTRLQHAKQIAKNSFKIAATPPRVRQAEQEEAASANLLLQEASAGKMQLCPRCQKQIFRDGCCEDMVCTQCGAN
jgi:hypothetical protein